MACKTVSTPENRLDIRFRILYAEVWSQARNHDNWKRELGSFVGERHLARFPSNLHDAAIQTMLKQTEALSAQWAA